VVRRDDGSPARVDFDPYGYPDINEMIDSWLDISFALNNINRSMGQPDIYPFVISPVVKEKLSFVQTFYGSRPAPRRCRRARRVC
jgi:hypothetical protein